MLEVLLNNAEIDLLRQCVSETRALEGDMAEVGVYQGGSAKEIANTNPEKHLHLFDTFEGLPFSEGDFTKGQFSCDASTMISDIFGTSSFEVHKGIFPETAKDVENKKFCFVHIDCDLSKCIMDSIEFFWPRLVKGGILLIHDASNEPVKTLIQKYFNMEYGDGYLKVVK